MRNWNWVLCLLLVARSAWSGSVPVKKGYDSLQSALRAARHEASAKGAGFAVENPENRLEGEFTASGLSVSHPRGRFALRLEGYGYGEVLTAPAPAAVRASGNRVEYLRGPLTEWYVNQDRGLEQGFTLHSRPAGPPSGLLTLELSVTGDFETRLEDEAILLTRDEQPVIRYSGLQAWDATGRLLPARMEIRGQSIRLLVSDADAVFPVTIDPWLQQAMLAASDPAANDNFGYSVSVSGDTAISGSFGKNNSQGAAYIFVRNGGSWSQQQKLTANDGLPGDQFGFSVSLSGDTAVVGAPGYPAGRGAAYVFVRSGTVWTQQAKLTAGGEAQANDVFGFSVSVSGDSALVGAYGRSSYQGVAYVFTRSGVTWTQQQKLAASDGVANDFFSYSVAIDVDTALIGAYGKNSSRGTVYVFVRSAGVWSEQQKLPLTKTVLIGSAFGKRLALSGDTAVVGAPGESASQGGAYVYIRVGGIWSLQSGLGAADLQAGDNFGFSVAVEGGTALVGAFGQASSQGAAYLFSRSGTTWILQQKIQPAGGQPADAFGISVSVSGDTALIGAYGKTGYQGAAYVFLSNGSLWAEQQIVSAASDGAAGDEFGNSVAVSGSTAVVGAFQKTSNQGAAYVFLRTGTTWSLQQKLLASDGVPGDFFGVSVAVSGNIAVVGAFGKASYQGAVYVFVRSGTTWSQSQKLTASDGTINDYFGRSVAVSGTTVVVGASGKWGSQGAVYVFSRGHGTFWSEQQGLKASDGATLDNFGFSVSVDSGTILVGAPYNAASRGAAYVFVLNSTTWSQQQKLTASDGAGNTTNVPCGIAPGLADCFGDSVSVNVDTAVVGAMGKSSNQGAAYVFVRSGTTWTQQQILTASDGVAGNQFGGSVGLSGDTTVVGAYANAGFQGAAYVFARSGTTWSQQQKLTASDGAIYDQFGVSVAIDGDTAVVGAYGKASYQGAAYMYQLSYLLRTAASPLTGGSVIPASGTYFYPGTIVPLQAVPNSGYGFGGWTGPVADPASVATTVTMTGPVSVVATFVPPVQVTVNTNTAGLSFVVDNITYSAAQTFSWAAGSQHQISVVAIQPGGAGTQFVWLSWSDGQAASHTVAPTTATTYTANFKTQFQLAVQAGSGGTVTPQTAFFDAASSVNISATPNAGFTFSGWTGTGSGSYTGPNASSSVTMNAPITETAAFNSLASFTARLNAGGTVYNDPQGNLWSPDPNVANTFTFLTQNPIRNTNKPYLYQSERFSLGTPFQYTFASVPNGTYNVRLMFAETYFTQPGQRKFSVNINGAAALTNFDIVAAAGGSNTAVDTLHSVNVTNGQIAIQFVPVLSNPKISAIEITPQVVSVALLPGISDPLASGATQQFTTTVVGNANTAVSYTLSPNIGNITAGGLYTAASVANPTRVTLTATSVADNTKSATAIVQLVPQAWTSLDVGAPNVAGSSFYTGNAFNLGGAGDLVGSADALRFTYNTLTGDGSIIARVNQPFTGLVPNKSGVMMRNDLTPGSSYGFTGLYSSIVGLFHWRGSAGVGTNFQFGAAGVPWVRLTRVGNTLASYVSNDATAWIPVGAPQTLATAGVNVGLAASNGYGGVLDTVTFDNIDLSASPVAVSINEGLSSLAAGQQAQFTANVTGTGNSAVTWSISPAGQGTIDGNTGVYTAPATINPSPQTVTVTATSVADPSKSASVVVYLGAFQVIRVNCGGPSHYDPTGTFWYGDVGAVGGAGNVYSSGNSIANTLTPYLYQSERFMANAPLVYKYYVPNGSYNVTLKFAEIYFGATGQRVMNVTINGTAVLTNFDLVAQGGANTAVDRTFPVVVGNGAISISLAPAVAGHAPKVNAIQIQ